MGEMTKAVMAALLGLILACSLLISIVFEHVPAIIICFIVIIIVLLLRCNGKGGTTALTYPPK